MGSRPPGVCLATAEHGAHHSAHWPADSPLGQHPPPCQPEVRFTCVAGFPGPRTWFPPKRGKTVHAALRPAPHLAAPLLAPAPGGHRAPCTCKATPTDGTSPAGGGGPRGHLGVGAERHGYRDSPPTHERRGHPWARKKPTGAEGRPAGRGPAGGRAGSRPSRPSSAGGGPRGRLSEPWRDAGGVAPVSPFPAGGGPRGAPEGRRRGGGRLPVLCRGWAAGPALGSPAGGDGAAGAVTASSGAAARPGAPPGRARRPPTPRRAATRCTCAPGPRRRSRPPPRTPRRRICAAR